MNGAGKGLCFSCVVFGDYQKYIPFYIYSALKVYPDAWCKIFVDRELDIAVAESLELLNETGTDRFDIDYVFLKHLDFLDEINDLQIMGGNKRIARWIIPQNNFSGFDYVFIGDIDFLMLRESESLISFHLRRIQEYGLPFSNIIRPIKDNQIPRLSGLHFIQIKEYYKRLNNEIEHLNKKNNLVEFIKSEPEPHKIDNNEKFLYLLIKKHFSFNDSQLIKFEAHRPWHGIHLGAARGFKLDRNKFEIGSTIDFNNANKQVNGFLSDLVFRKILFKLNETSVWNTLEFFSLRHNSIKFFISRYLYKLKVFIRKISLHLLTL